MNLGKARDYFSSYYEGSLDNGLKQSFEARLQEDAQLQAEYRAFERTMRELDSLQTVEIEVPSDLHERISARLDLHVWEQKQQAKPGLGAWWRGLIAGSVVAAGAFFAIYQFNAPNTTPGGYSSAGINLEFKGDSEKVNVSYPGSGKTVVIKDADGKVLEKIELNNQTMENKPLENKTPTALILSVEVEGSKKSTLIALPGTKAETNVKGSGTLKDFAKALAGFYRMPIQVNVKSSERPVTWDFERNSDVVSAAQNALKDSLITVSQADPGLRIEEN